jgi:phosphoribosylglycinamide formyltransferase-1
MARGQPGLPEQFTWNGKPFVIKKQLRTWKDTGPCRHGSGESYVRKHWFEVETGDGITARLYFERQQRGRNRMQRWWLHSMG